MMKTFTREALGMKDGIVYVVDAGMEYPDTLYFHPTEAYPEYPFFQNITSGGMRNKIYKAVRQLFIDMDLDSSNMGSPAWNPLREFVQPGNTILIKPNWVSHFIHGEVTNRENILEVLVTHTSIIRAVVDYAFLAVGTSGKIILADSPIQGTDFNLLLDRIAIKPLIEFYKRFSVPIEILDLRKVFTYIDHTGKLVEHIQLSGDPQGYTLVKVDQHSMLLELDKKNGNRYRVYDYDAKQMKTAHGVGLHRYLISNTVLNADLIINLPKLKSHIKTGMTCAMKNFVGANGDKSFLPHYRAGSPTENGDDYAKKNIWRLLKAEYRYKVAHWPNWIRFALRGIGNHLIQISDGDNSKSNVSDPYASSGGSWHGNDTAWRMVVDINTALLYTNTNGEIENCIQRRWLTIVDAVIGGEGSGPLSPNPVKVGYLLGGTNPVEIDYLCAQIMGFDWQKLKFIQSGIEQLFHKRDFEDVQIMLNGNLINNLDGISQYKFQPPSGWDSYLYPAD